MSNKSSSASQNYDYFGTIMIGLGEGPLDGLGQIVADNKTLWTGPLMRSSSFSDVITVADWGTFEIHWGLPGQPVSSILSAYETHPAYGNQAYIVYKGLLGFERTTCPNFEFVTLRRPNQSLITGSAALLDSNSQANWVAFSAELITSATGLGWSNSRLDATSWQSMADGLNTADQRSVHACSPLLTTQGSVRSILEALGTATQIFARRKTDGTIELKRWTPPSDVSGLPLITAADCSNEPETDTEDMDTLPTDYTVEFTDASRLYKKSSVRVPDLASYRVTTQPSSENLSRPDITNVDQAKRFAYAYMRQRRGGSMSGQRVVRRSKGKLIREGDYFRVDADTIPGGSGTAVLVRCLRRRIKMSGPITLEFESEPLSAPIPFTLPTSAPVIEDAVLGPLYYQRIFSLPPDRGEGPFMSVLAARSDDSVIGMDVMYDHDSVSGTFPSIGKIPGFALPVTLSQAVTSAATTIQVKTFATFGDGSRADRERWLLSDGAGATATEAADDTLLLVLLKKNATTGDLLQAGSALALEVCSISSIALASADTWNLGVLRGRQGTAASAFDTTGGATFPDAFLNFEGWVIQRSSLVRLYHAEFIGLLRAASPGWFRFRPYSRSISYDPATAHDAGLQSDANWTTWGYHWPTGDDVPADALELQYSADGTSWHTTYVDATDVYMRQRMSTGAWGATLRIRGLDGPTGPMGPVVGPGGSTDGSGTNWWCYPNVSTLNRSAVGAYSPLTVTFTAMYYRNGMMQPAAFAGYWKVYETLDGTNWTQTYASGSAESTLTRTPSLGIIAIRARLYSESSFTNQRGEQLLNVTSDGNPGTPGAAGTAATTYWAIASAAAIGKSQLGAYTPSSITFSASSQTGLNAPAAYAGRWILAETTDGTSYSTVYTSSADESSKVWTPSAGIKALRARLYIAGGTTAQVDEYLIPVVTDGATGAPGAASTSYWLAALAPLKKSIASVYTPSTVTLSALSAAGAAAPAAYAGRFKIEDTPDGTTWTTRYTSSSDQSTYSWTPTAGITQFRVSLFMAGGTTTLVDQVVVPVALDGATGAASTAYWLAALAPLKKSAAGVYTPSIVTVSALYSIGSAPPSGYTGRFKIEDTPDGTTWTTRYTSSVDQASYAWTPTAGITQYRVSLYQAGGTTTLVDQVTVPVALDGAVGVTYIFPVTQFTRDPSTNAITPTSGAFPANSITAGVTASYSGRFIIEDTLDNGTTWTARYTSAADESTCTYTPAQSTAITHYRISLYAAGGTTNLLTRQVVAFAVKGVTGPTGPASIAYWLAALAPLKKSITGVYTPSTVVLTALSATGGGSPAAYSGRFKVEDSPDGMTWTTRYTSASDQSTYTWTPTAGITQFRVSLFMAGGTTTLVDQVTAPVVLDGATGTRGSVNKVWAVSTSVWADSDATAALTANGLTAQTNDVVTLYNSSTAFSESRIYSGSAWVNIGQYLSGNILLAGTMDVSVLKAITAYAKQFTISTGGSFNCGQTAFNTGIGWWMAYNAGNPQVSFGSSSGNYLTFDTTNGIQAKVSSFKLNSFEFYTGSDGVFFTGANATFRANKINQLAAYAPFPFQLSIFSGVIATGVMNAEEGRLIMTKTYENVTIPGSPTYTYGHLLYGGDAIAFSTGTKDVSGAYPITNSITFSGAGITFGGPSCVSTFNGSSLVVNSPATITDRINLWSASNPVLDIQNSLRITTSNGAFQIAKIDGGNILWNAPLRIQPNTATVLVSATVARHLAQGGFTAPTSGTDWWLSFDITNKGFTSKPNWGMGQAIEDSMYSVAYRDDASTTTTAYFMVRKRSGAAWAGELVWVKTILELIA